MEMDEYKEKDGCWNCKFFQEFWSGASECRRNAPKPHTVGNKYDDRFPWVSKNDWCGEWSKK